MSKWSFISHITDYMSRPRLGNQKAPTQWPSEASAVITNQHNEKEIIGKCRRAAYFRLLLDAFNFSPKYSVYESLIDSIQKQKKDTDPYMRWVWAQGNLYEEHCINLAKESGVFIETQTPVYVPDYNVSGKLDIVVINPDTGKLKIIEAKSVYGFGANKVLGTPGERKKGALGEPRESHLMQIGLYQWWYGNNDDRFEDGLLLYGARDTGRYAEYTVTVESSNSEERIFYQGNSPNQTEKTDSGISIENILSQYEYIAKCLDSGEIPARDFELKYSDEKIGKLHQIGELSKKDSEQYVKRKKQIEEGKAKPVKAVEKGDWQCRFCDYQTVCYDGDGADRKEL